MGGIPSFFENNRRDCNVTKKQRTLEGLVNGQINWLSKWKVNCRVSGCWAAVSTSVSRYFDTNSTWRQCTVANHALTLRNCCRSGSSRACNKEWYLSSALSVVGAFDGMTNSIESLTTVKSEIGAGRPLCVRIDWAGNGGHFLAIIGWMSTTSSGHFYNVDDPLHGSQRIAKSKLETSYLGYGQWSHSYFVADPTIGNANVAAARGTNYDPKALGG